jgi:hypothetical protein
MQAVVVAEVILLALLEVLVVAVTVETVAHLFLLLMVEQILVVEEDPDLVVLKAVQAL